MISGGISWLRTTFSLKARLLGLCVFVIAFSLLVTSIGYYTVYQNKIENRNTQSTLLLDMSIAVAVRTGLRIDELNDVRRLSESVVNTSNISSLRIEAGGKIISNVGTSGGKELIFPINDEVLGYSEDSFSDFVITEKTVVEVAKVYYTIDKTIYGQFGELLTQFLVSLGLLLLLMIPPLILVYKSISMPIKATTSYANKYRKGHIKSVPPSEYSDEHSVLQNSLHELIESVEAQKTELKKREQTAIEKQILADNANYAKDQFVQQISHIVQTPIGVVTSSNEVLDRILGEKSYELAEILNGRSRTPEKEYLAKLQEIFNICLEHVDRAARNSRKLKTTFDQVMSVVGVIYNGVQLNPQVFDVVEKMQNLADTYRVKFKGKNIKLSFKQFYAEGLSGSIFVESDWVHICHIVNELVSNAFRFTSSGEVIIACYYEADNDEASLRISVSDTGCGVPEKKINDIFEVFRISEEVSRKVRSELGAGLAMASQKAKALGGQLLLDESLEGVGSTFSLKLKVPIGEERDVAKTLSIQSSTRQRLLFVDDNSDNRINFKMIGEQYGFEVTLASSAQEGFDKFKNTEFDALVLDIHMPEQNGIDLIKLIRLEENMQKMDRNLVFSFTAENTQRNADECFESGFDYFLTKPALDSTFMEIEERIKGFKNTKLLVG